MSWRERFDKNTKPKERAKTHGQCDLVLRLYTILLRVATLDSAEARYTYLNVAELLGRAAEDKV